MRRFRTLSVLAAMVAALTLTSCSGDDGSPVQPEAQPAPTTLIPPGSTMTPEQESQLLLGFLVGTLVNTTETVLNTTTGLLGAVLACPNYRHYEESQTVGPWGGYIQAGPASLYIPPGALDRNVTITATVPVNSSVTVVKFGSAEGMLVDCAQGNSIDFPPAALLIALRPDLSADEVLALLASTATDLGDAGRDPLYGYGLADAYAAATAAVPEKMPAKKRRRRAG